ncbi:Dioxygenase [Rhodovastum atsumiense]|uniref:Dioxygenase n=1 Tax=Rhodovastum atsumiense TaxID=504468 RepID=A0A5M6ITA2_9PROT|nr:carotenoid oxygenase family protein [Rhodovastum atsumiense]KAA5610675.1 carotenoid oxygenase family protein [Rhodovastum atsumiense]CAH2603331.1 Dioxygenase [Rhodovastum atsumiense]
MQTRRHAVPLRGPQTDGAGGRPAHHLPVNDLAASPAADNPFLQGAYAPVGDECDLSDLPVRGALPEGLQGSFLRNGPNVAFPPLSYSYPFDGDGMVHALSFRGGRVAYRNRFVETRGLRAERRAGRALYGSVLAPVLPEPALIGPDGDPGPIKNTANTNVIHHAGRTLALWEGGLPTELGPQLETIGLYDFDGQITDAFTAHPKPDPASGELVAFRYRLRPPFLVGFVIDAEGRVARRIELEAPVPVMLHDFAATATHMVFFLCPVVLDPEAVAKGGSMLSWQPERGTRIAVVPRDGAGPVRWFETEPFFVFHFLNAFDAGGRIVVDYVQYAGFGPAVAAAAPPCLWRAELDPGTGRVERRPLSDRRAEFPRVDPAVLGRPNRHGWSTGNGATPGHAASFGALIHYDLGSGATELHDFGPGQAVGEPVFIPRPGGKGEADGWIGAWVYDQGSDTSRFVLLEALAIGRPPVAEVMLPRRVPHGFHGNWVA